MVSIILSNIGKEVFIDDADYELVSQYAWYGVKDHHTYYACTHTTGGDKRSTIRMHRLIMKASVGQQVDHVNRNGLDNQRQNLRLATQTQNNANTRKRAGTSSKHKGVTWNKQKEKWQAQLFFCKKHIHLGSFLSEDEAAVAYNNAAVNYFGEFASLNKVET